MKYEKSDIINILNKNIIRKNSYNKIVLHLVGQNRKNIILT